MQVPPVTAIEYGLWAFMALFMGSIVASSLYGLVLSPYYWYYEKTISCHHKRWPHVDNMTLRGGIPSELYIDTYTGTMIYMGYRTWQIVLAVVMFVGALYTLGSLAYFLVHI